MTQVTKEPGLLRQFWRTLLAPSEVAVAIGYAAPWRICRR